MNFPYRYFLTILIMVTEQLYWRKVLCGCFGFIWLCSTYCYYEKVGRTIRTAIVLYFLKSLVLVSQKAPAIVETEWPKFLNLIILHSLKRHLRHFKFKKTLVFFAFYFFGCQSLGVDTASTASKSHWLCWSCFKSLLFLACFTDCKWGWTLLNETLEKVFNFSLPSIMRSSKIESLLHNKLINWNLILHMSAVHELKHNFLGPVGLFPES